MYVCISIYCMYFHNISSIGTVLTTFIPVWYRRNGSWLSGIGKAGKESGPTVFPTVPGAHSHNTAGSAPGSHYAGIHTVRVSDSKTKQKLCSLLLYIQQWKNIPCCWHPNYYESSCPTSDFKKKWSLYLQLLKAWIKNCVIILSIDFMDLYNYL